MADVITDWTDPDGKKLGTRLTREAVEDMTERLNKAITEGQAKVNELQTQLEQLNGHIMGLGDARKRLEPLLHATQHLLAIQATLDKLSSSTHGKPKHKT